MVAKNAELTINVRLAEALSKKHPDWKFQSECTGVLKGSSGKRPDIVSTGSASPMILETEFFPAKTVEEDAKKRLGEILESTRTPIHRVLAVRLPKELQTAAGPKILADKIKSAHYSCCLWTCKKEGHTQTRWPEEGWLDVDLDGLANLLEHIEISYEEINAALECLENSVSAATGIMGKASSEVNTKIAKHLHQAAGEQTTKMAMTILANALTFQEMIAESDLGGENSVQTTGAIRSQGHGKLLKPKVKAEWKNILDINYWPIFGIATEILGCMGARTASAVLEKLVEASDYLAASAVTRSHDLYGCLFQQLISDRKFLATFYTKPASATLLAELAVGSLQVDWGDTEEIKKLHIADMACGTGTLLSAAYQAILSRYRRTAKTEEETEADLHAAMMAEALIAVDIMPAATHLTISMLSSAHPTQIFSDTRVYTVPYGVQSNGRICIGALDLLDRNYGSDVLGDNPAISAASGTKGPQKLTPKELRSKKFTLKHDLLDLVIMNPPFTSPTNHKMSHVPVPSFAGFANSDEEQNLMAATLKKLRATLHSPAGHGNAGLASNFIDLANAKLKNGGTLALVLPLSFAQGSAWANARALLTKNYEDIRILSIAAAKVEDKAFSADTGMGEVLVLARKKETSLPTTEVNWVMLEKCPDTTMESAVLAGIITRALAKKNENLKIGNASCGCILQAGIEQAGCVSVTDLALAQTAVKLEAGVLCLPRLEDKMPLPVTKLSQLGCRGKIDRDINGGINNKGNYRGPFDIEVLESEKVPTYPCLWAHHAGRECNLVVHPDSEGSVRKGMDEKAGKVWATATRLHFNRDFQLNSQPLAACLTPEPCIGGRAWPNFTLNSPGDEETMALWANSTLGLLLFWWVGNSPQAGRSSITVGRLPDLHVLDTRKLNAQQRKKAARIFASFRNRDFLPANEAYRDDVRKDLDRAVLIDLLGLSEEILAPLDLLRRKWCAEPTVHGGKKSTKPPRADF